MPWFCKYAYFFSDFLHFDMSLFIIDCYPAGVSNKHCLLPLFSFCFVVAISDLVHDVELYFPFLYWLTASENIL